MLWSGRLNPALARSRLLACVVLTITYVAAGRLGLFLALPPGYATAIFPPVGGGEDPRINGAGFGHMASDCGDDAAVLAAVQHASRRLRRCPTGMLDRRCARRADGTQVGTTGWPS